MTISLNCQVDIKINDNFNLSDWIENEKFSGKVYYSGEELATRLIGIPKKRIFNFYFILFRSLYKLNKGGNLEGIIIKKMGLGNINNISKFGLTGFIAPTGRTIDE